MANTREIVVRILGDAKGAQRASREAEKALGSLGVLGNKASTGLGTVQGYLNNLGKLGAGAGAGLSRIVTGLQATSPAALAGAAGIAALGVGIAELTKAGVGKFVQLTGEIRQLQRVSGASAEDSSRFAYAFKILGVDVDTASRALGILSKNVESGKLAKLGVQAVGASAGNKQMTETILRVADAYEKADGIFEKNNVALQAFGRGGLALVPILQRGREGLKALFEEAEKHHLVFSPEELERGKEFSLQMKSLQGAVTGLEVSLGERIVPALTKGAELATKFVDAINGIDQDSDAGSFISKEIEGLVPGLSLFDAAKDAFDGNKTVVDRLRGSVEHVITGVPLLGGVLAFAGEKAHVFARSTDDAKSSLSALAAQLGTTEDGINDLNAALGEADPYYAKVKSVVLGARDAKRDLAAASTGERNAEERLADARYSLNQLLTKGAVDAKAVASAHREVESTAKSEQDAEERLADALENLNRVRRGATDLEKRQASLSLRQSVLAEVEATKRRTDAVKALNDARRKGNRSDIQDAELALQEASLGVEQSQISREEAQNRVNDTNNIGEEADRRLRDAEKEVRTATDAVTTAKQASKDASDRLREAERGDVNFAHEVQQARNNVRDAEEGVQKAKQTTVDASAKYQEALDAENRLLAVQGAAASLLVAELAELVKLYPELKPILDRLAPLGPKLANPIPFVSGLTGIPTGDGSGPGTFQSLIADANRSGIPFSVNSTYRPGAITSTGNLSYHAQGKAVDFGGSGSNLARLFRYFEPEAGKGGRISEMFYSPMGYGWDVGRRLSNSQIAPSVVRDHYDHLHVATYDRGGVLPPGLTLALNKTGKNEYVHDPMAPMAAGPIVINVNGADDPAAVAREVKRELVAELKRNGRSTITTRR